MKLVYDIEADNLLPEVTVIHCIVVKDTNTGRIYRYADAPGFDVAGTIEDGLAHLAQADEVWGHNIVGYDIPACRKVRKAKLKLGVRVRDSLVLSRVIYTDLKDRDFRFRKKKPAFPPQMIGRHSLEAWGHRLANYKGDFKGPFTKLTQEMLDYCVQDVEVADTLRLKIEEKKLSEECIDIEHQVAAVIQRQEAYGFALDMARITKLYADLVAHRDRLTKELGNLFPAWFMPDGEFTPKRDNKKQGYTAGVPFSRVVLTQFNPASRDHIADRLKKLYGWKPTKFTDGGKPAVDDEVMEDLPYPPAKALAEYLMVGKRIGQVAEGKEAWLKHERNGRIHGGVNSNGAVTGRMTHFKPNVGQTPAIESKKGGLVPYGRDCRECFIATPKKGKKLVGCDGDALELRDLAGFMARYDGGAYIKTVLEGKKEDGTDMHSVNMRAILAGARPTAKTWFYAYIYGAGDGKLGSILGAGRQRGRKSRVDFEKNLPALGELVKAVRKAVRKRGYLIGVDGRHLHIRSDHAALNTLLQSAGAVQMKKALVILDTMLSGVDPLTLLTQGVEAATRFTPGVHYEFVANVHDEFQIEVDAGIAEEVGRDAAESIKLSGEYFKFRCPLKGNFGIGDNWAQTH